MFLINGHPLHEKTHPEEYKWMQKKMKEIRDSGKKQFTFKSFQKRPLIKREDGRLIPQKDRLRLVSVKGSTTEAAGVHQNWDYAASMSGLDADKSGGYKLRRPTIALTFDTNFSVENDIELIFFFKYLSKNRNVKEIDYEADRRKQVSNEVPRAKAYALIFDTDSPIHPETTGSESEMRNLAVAWGVGGSFDQDIYYVIQQLWAKVEDSQNRYRTTKRGFKEFIDEVKNYGNTEKRSKVVLGIENGNLVYKGNIWKLITSGGTEMFLCGVPPTDEARKDDYVMKYILDNNSVFEALEASLKKPLPVEDNKEVVKNFEPLGLKRHELLAKAKELGWSGSYYRDIAKMKKDELEDLVRDQRTPIEG